MRRGFPEKAGLVVVLLMASVISLAIALSFELAKEFDAQSEIERSRSSQEK